MEKTIKCVLDAEKNILIYLDNIEKHRILSGELYIKASEIYELLDYYPNDHYLVLSENPNNYDAKVLDFFVDILKEIASGINNIETIEETPHAQD